MHHKWSVWVRGRASDDGISNLVPHMWYLLRHGIHHHDERKVVGSWHSHGVYAVYCFRYFEASFCEAFSFMIMKLKEFLSQSDLCYRIDLLMMFMESFPCTKSIGLPF